MSRRLIALLVLCTLTSACAYRYETQDLVQAAPPPVAQSSFIYDNAGNQLLLLRADENRVYKRIDEIPMVLQEAVVAIEDERFYLHKGVDLKGIIRSARSGLSAGEVNQGASTITQQYVGNVYLDREDRTAKRKLQEIALARQFEQRYTKDYILELYLNWVFLGNNANGVQAAAKGYFNKDVAELSLPEAALIAGLIQRPSDLNPYRSSTAFEASKSRRNQVLGRMLANEFITQAEHDDAVAAPIVLRPYVPVEDEQYEAPHFVEEVKKWFLANEAFGATEAERETLLFEGGLRIYTTIDMELQRAAEQARNEVLPGVEGLDAAIVTMDATNGNVLAMVGGKNYFGESDFAKVNLAVGDGRQTGSSAKPIALAAALSAGWELTKMYPAPSTIALEIPGLAQQWKVKGGGSGADVNLIQATAQSYNTVYAQLMLDLGPDPFVQMAAQLGVTQPIAPVYAAALGTENITMLSMATAFGTFAARGIRHDPVYVTRIVRADGTTLFQHNYTQTKAIEARVADQVNFVLEGGVDHGTGRAAQIGRPVAGKTGSAENNADATFVGYTPDRATAVWVGFPEGQVPMVPPTTPIAVYGGTYPAQIFAKVMSAATANLPVQQFAPPPPSSTSTTTTVLGELSPVPDVRGMPGAQAEQALVNAGFVVARYDIETAEYTAGTVTSQAPNAGTSAPLNSEVIIEVAVTPSTATVVVPDVRNLSRSQATSQLKAAGFTVLQVFEPAPATVTPRPVADQVWRQSPTPASPRPADGVVQISIQP